MKNPVFYDESGQRDRWTVRGFLLLLAGIVIAAVIFAGTVVEVPVPGPLALDMERPMPRPLKQQVNHLRHKLSLWLPHHKGTKGQTDPLAVGFYVPWDDASRSSLASHVSQLNWVIPAFYSVTGPNHTFTATADPGFDAIMTATAKRPKVLPMVQNAAGDTWDGAGSAVLFHNPAARKAFLARLGTELTAKHANGVVFDFENLPVSSLSDYRILLAQARQRFSPRGWQVAVTVPVGDDDWDMKAFAASADKLILMAYDQHSAVDQPGPIAAQPWFVQKLEIALAKIPASQAIVALGNYAYDWKADGKSRATDMTVEEAWLSAHDSQSTITFDAQSGNPTFRYQDNDGQVHTVWMLDAATTWNQIQAAKRKGVAGYALWRLGSEDPGVWPILDAADGKTFPDISVLQSVGNVDIEGEGEILRISEIPRAGHRSVTLGANDLVVGEHFRSFPTPYIVNRVGNVRKSVAITFDDGPDPEWTPRILDVLRSRGVPATFFVIGENAMDYPFLVRRLVDEGHEIGNHTFTHPNLADVSSKGTRLELNATQRVIEAYTGRSTRLFRAPYFGDAEPTTAEELVPAYMAQQAGYTNVGLHVDPNDWQRPGVDAIVNTAVTQVEAGTDDHSAQIILLHDGGGNRAQTVAALPQIIDRLRAAGYKFVPVSELAGLSRDQVMPIITGRDLISVRADVGIFLLLSAISLVLKWLFFAAIFIGMARAIVLTVLAKIGARPHNRPTPPAIDKDRFVSVLIPAYNEAKVIEASIHRVLASTDVRIEVIVIDDGSQDATGQIVRSAFSDDPRVRLLTLANGGKAHALNRGLELAGGEIVIALDADTQFEPETIARLARWFSDPAVGAIAGNAKVGNRVNLVTRWQAIEYITAQNLERRALAQFDAILVVPGAIGAWRRTALDDVGGYPTDTLAEDQDLTIAIQRHGWAVGYDSDAIAWTEAPETLRALAKQRFRWAFGTLQCLWKHRQILRERNPVGLAYVGVPQAWVFQIGFAVISPLIDLALVASLINTVIRVIQHGWAQTQSDVLRMAIYWLVFTLIDLICGWVAYRLERREKRYPALLLLAQRIVYRQLMYGVVIGAVANAVRGLWVGWGKLERTGRVQT